MCRIAGIISSKTEPAETYRQVKAMCQSLQHGGPDDEGIYLSPDGAACLGHRRLAILDLSKAGHQPMDANEGQLWISFNGEIYNFRELRTELEKAGLRFNTQTDTEVILKAYQHWGTEAFGKLTGMFAFALTDYRQQETYLVRDANGIKPLYYSITGQELLFASEVKAFRYTGRDFSHNETWKVYLLAFGHIPEPYTTLSGVHSLPKGHYLCWKHREQTFTIHQFQRFSYSEMLTDPAEAIFRLKDTLYRAVQQHLIADAPIGVFLSGGIDSSILTLIADSYQHELLNTLSINLQETDYSEKKYQQLVTQKTTGKHAEYFITYKEFIQNFDTITGSMDQPSADGINSWFVSKYARENGLKAVLSGLGGDELFGGYPSFQRINTIAVLKKLPASWLRLTEKHPDPKFKRLCYLAYDNPAGEYLFLRGFYTPRVIAAILDAEHRQVDQLLHDFPLDTSVNSLSGGNRASWFETNLYMQNQLLKDTDYMSMSHGIEVRVPFLDQELVSLVLSIHPAVKFDPQQQKGLLVNAFKDLLPEPVWNRKKMGFSFPFQEWMRRFERISDPGLYTNKTARKLMRDFHNGRLHWSSAFALYHVHHEQSSSINPGYKSLGESGLDKSLSPALSSGGDGFHNHAR